MSSDAPMTDYSLRIAERHVHLYNTQDKDLMARHQEAMECCECEEFLNTGIEAYRWLRQADEILREAARQGLEVSGEAIESLKALYRLWLDPIRHARNLIKAQQANGFSISNLDDFNEACEHVRNEVQKQRDYTSLDEVIQGIPFDTGFWEEAAQLRKERS